MAVIIAGAGIGGLSLALSLHQVGIPCRIYEAVPSLRPLGVGINIQPHAVRELSELGLLDDLDAIGIRTREVAYLSSHGKLIWSEPRGLLAGYRWPQVSVHRGELQMLLYRSVVERLGEDAIVLGHAVVDWKNCADGISVGVAPNGEAARIEAVQGQLLICADGIHSSARAKLYPNEGPPRWGGTVMWRGTTRGPRYMSGATMAMAGCKARKFVCYPITDQGDECLINWIADLGFPSDYAWNRESWNRQGALDDFLPHFTDWHFDWLDIPKVITEADAVYEYPMVDRDPVAQWTFGRMSLLGDSAHAMYPIGSNGASQAILDARVLTRELVAHGPTPAALQAYEDERRPATAKIVLANRGDGPDKVLDIVEEKAPKGFDHIHEVLSQDELERIAGAYKQLAGMDVEGLNKRASIVNA